MSKVSNEYKYLYELFYTDQDVDYPFYVGKTNDPERRYKEHKSAWKKGTEAKYIFVREIESAGLSWGLKKIKQIPIGDYCEDWERFVLIEYIRDGHIMTNMKHGDLDKIITEQVGDVKIRSVEDVKNDRVKREKQTEQQVMDKAKKLQAKIRADQPDETDKVLIKIQGAMSIKSTFIRVLKETGWRNGIKVIGNYGFHRWVNDDGTKSVSCRPSKIYIDFGTAFHVRNRGADDEFYTSEGKTYGECYTRIAKLMTAHIVLGDKSEI